MNEIMPVIEIPNAFDFVEEDADAYVEGYGSGAKDQRDADRKAIFLKLASYPRHYEVGIRYLHMPVEDWEKFKKECFTLKEAIDG